MREDGTKRVVAAGAMLAGASIAALAWPWRSPERVAAASAGGMLLIWGLTHEEAFRRFAGRRMTRSGIASVHHDRAVKIERSITVQGRAEDVYRIWRNPENIPCFMEGVESVRAINGSRSHWIVRGPAGRRFEWESEIYNERENDSFTWHSLLNADVNNAGSIHFRKAGDSATEIRVILSYEPPGGRFGALFTRFSGRDPAKQLELGLQNFKHAYESGKLAV